MIELSNGIIHYIFHKFLIITSREYSLLVFKACDRLMIKLTLRQQSNVQSFLFTKDCVTIGEGQSDNVDISLKGHGLHQNHIKFTIIGNAFYVINQANDPFISLNGLPFGKKKVKPQDTIQIKDCTITVEELQIEQAEQTKPNEVETDTVNLEDQICDFPNAEKLSKEDDLEGWFPSDLSELNIEDIAKIDDSKSLNKSANEETSFSFDESLAESKGQPKTSFFSLKKLKWIAAFAALLFIICSAVSIEMYLRAASKSGVEENKAAESLADLAMALTYANVYHIIPQNHNYSDPEFLKNNLTSLLPGHSSLSCTVDTQGLFSNCDYLFRFYSDQNLSRFIIIAQPAPSISQWLFPKDAILIDSALMDLRKISDLKIINSLLAAAKPFDGSNGRELSEAIKSLKILSLPHLAKNVKKRDLAPPRILKYLKPGSENFIYNAPRYFLFTEPLRKKLISYELNGSLEANTLESEIERFAIFDNLILYSPDGLQDATKANKALYALNKFDNFLAGYLLLSQTEEILSSRLIIDAKEGNSASLPKQEMESLEIAEADKNLLPLPFTHPLNRKFERFRNATLESLQPLLRQMIEIIEESLQNDGYDLKGDFYLLLNNFQKTKQEQKRKLNKLIHKIEQKYPEKTSFEIFQYIKRYNLEHLTDDLGHSLHHLSFLNEAPFLQSPKKSSPPFR